MDEQTSHAPWLPSLPIGVAAILLAVGVFAPWITASDPIGTATITGLRIDGTDAISSASIWLLAGALALALVSVARLNHGVNERVAATALVTFILAPIYFALSEHSRLDAIVLTLHESGYQAAIGWGWWATILAVLFAGAGLLATLSANRKALAPRLGDA